MLSENEEIKGRCNMLCKKEEIKGRWDMLCKKEEIKAQLLYKVSQIHKWDLLPLNVWSIKAIK